MSEIKNAITKYQLQINKIESKIKEFENNKSEIQKKIYGGVVSNIKELQALKNEDEKIERDSKELNEYANKFLTNLSLMEEKVLKIEEEVDILIENWSLKSPELKNNSDDLKTTIEKYKSDRKNLFESIPDDLSMIYERLLQAKNIIAVSKVESGSCSVCRVKFPLSTEKQLVLGNDIVFCDNCGRILVII